MLQRSSSRYDRSPLLGLAVLVLLIWGCAAEQTPASESDSTPTAMSNPVDPSSAGGGVAPSELGPDRTPEQTVSALLRALYAKQFEAYYALVSTRDRQAKTLDSLKAEFKPSNADLVTDFLFQQISFTVDSTQVMGDTAWVYVASTLPDMEAVLHQANIIERDLGDSFNLQNKLGVLEQRFKMVGSPMQTRSVAYPLIREADGWHALIGWAEQATAAG